MGEVECVIIVLLRPDNCASLLIVLGVNRQICQGSSIQWVTGFPAVLGEVCRNHAGVIGLGGAGDRQVSLNCRQLSGSEALVFTKRDAKRNLKCG